MQTATAIFATSTLFIPALAMIGSLMPYMKKERPRSRRALTSFLTAFIATWMFVILIRIVRSAFEWTWPRSDHFSSWPRTSCR